MKSQKFSRRQKKLKPLLLRRIEGKSMLPTLPPGKVVIATSLYRELKPQHIVVIKHQGLEKIKRIRDIRQGQIFLVGDNSHASLDSRSFGWLPIECVSAKIIWPRA